MEFLCKTTYRILKALKKKPLLEETILRKFGSTSGTRLYALLNKEYIEYCSRFDKWGSAIEPKKYTITEKGLVYLEDCRIYEIEEKWTALKNSTIVPIIVSVVTHLLLNALSRWL